METRIAFIGALRGLNSKQKTKLESVLIKLKDKYKNVIILHGDRIGADAHIHNLALSLNIPVHIYPRQDSDKYVKANCIGAVKVMEPYPGLKQNGAMVQDCNILLATPPNTDENEKSGIQNTIKNAMYKKRIVYMITPEGFVWAGSGD